MEQIMTEWAPRIVMVICLLQLLTFICYVMAKDLPRACYWFAAVLLTVSTLFMKG